MSTCISSKGEYSSHTTTPGNYICEDCGVLDEEGLFDELETLRGKVSRVESFIAGMERLGAKTLPVDGLWRNLRAPITTEPEADRG